MRSNCKPKHRSNCKQNHTFWPCPHSSLKTYPSNPGCVSESSQPEKAHTTYDESLLVAGQCVIQCPHFIHAGHTSLPHRFSANARIRWCLPSQTSLLQQTPGAITPQFHESVALRHGANEQNVPGGTRRFPSEGHFN